MESTTGLGDVILARSDSVEALCLLSLVIAATAPDRPIFSNRIIQGKEFYHIRKDTIGVLLAAPEKLKNSLLILDRAYQLISPVANKTATTTFFEYLLAQYRHYNLVTLITTEDYHYVGKRVARMASIGAVCRALDPDAIYVEYSSWRTGKRYIQTIAKDKFLQASKLSYDVEEIPSFWADASFLKE